MSVELLVGGLKPTEMIVYDFGNHLNGNSLLPISQLFDNNIVIKLFSLTHRAGS